MRACKAVFDPDLEQGGNITVVVRRDLATGGTTGVPVHRWCPTSSLTGPGQAANRNIQAVYTETRTYGSEGAGRAILLPVWRGLELSEKGVAVWTREDSHEATQVEAGAEGADRA